MDPFFDFEKPIFQLETKLKELRELAKNEKLDLKSEIKNIEEKIQALTTSTYAHLTPWQRVQLSRHPNRPYAGDYIEALFPDFMELHGDRAFGDDAAIVGGSATFEDHPILILANQKGRSTRQKMERNFGMARPEGYRKAIRLMELAHRMGMPILTLIDTPGAYPGADAEERGQAQAIAESIQTLFRVRSPICAVVIGEGGSGGALALGVADRVLMQEYSTYSVISPESCASILWSDASLAEKAADRLKITPPDLLRLGVIDQIIPEPLGGAQRDWTQASQLLLKSLREQFLPLIQDWVNPPSSTRKNSKKVRSPSSGSAQTLGFEHQRREKFRKMGLEAFTSDIGN